MKKQSFLDDSPGLFDHWDCFALLMIGILSVYVAVSHDYPQMVWPFF